ncbi:MAG: hypothetical protein IPJ41_02390 [Phycisphaerales bacterium]|nr:hypothetical protein [Phycisphaerales bacterium]
MHGGRERRQVGVARGAERGVGVASGAEDGLLLLERRAVETVVGTEDVGARGDAGVLWQRVQLISQDTGTTTWVLATSVPWRVTVMVASG